MRTRERLLGLKEWITINFCDRELKSPAPDRSIAKVTYKKPECYLAWSPMRKDLSNYYPDESDANTAPFIKVMPRPSDMKNMEEKRFDRYNNINRSKDMGQKLSVDLLFCVYEPGIRLPGFIESADAKGKNVDLSLLKDGTEEGLLTLYDWMDDVMEALIGDKIIPGTDLIVDETKASYSLYVDQSYVMDKRPLYYGFITVTFDSYANGRNNKELNQLL